MTYWQGAARWVNTVLVAILAVLVLDGLRVLAGIERTNILARLVAFLGDVVVAPVASLFNGQPRGVTLLLAAVFWVVVAIVVLAIRDARRRGEATPPEARSGAEEPAAGARSLSSQPPDPGAEADATASHDAHGPDGEDAFADAPVLTAEPTVGERNKGES